MLNIHSINSFCHLHWHCSRRFKNIQIIRKLFINKLNIRKFLSCQSLVSSEISILHNNNCGNINNHIGGDSSNNHTRRKYCTNNNKLTMNKLRLSDYQCIGFDLDNTLVRYKISAVTQLEYNILADFLITEKGYNPDALLIKNFTDQDYDFLQRGLIVDIKRGNLLKLAPNGYINRAAHGTKCLSDIEIIDIYGKNREWNVTTNFTKDFLSTWNGPLADEMRTLCDYFDTPIALIFARYIDYLDGQKNNTQQQQQQQLYNIWNDIVDGLLFMYTREHFVNDKSPYFNAIKMNPEKYLHKTSENILRMLKELSKTKAIFCLTGSHIDFANCTASYALGSNWKDLFDSIICFAKKPGFFMDIRRPFMELDGINEINKLTVDQLKLKTIYSQGNWYDLQNILATKFPKINNNELLKILYIGDNILQDIYAPVKHTHCDAISTSEELMFAGGSDDDQNGNDENINLKNNSIKYGYDNIDRKILTSKFWGSYFGSPSEPNIWSNVLGQYSKLCIPNLDELAKNPIDYEYNCFINQLDDTDKLKSIDVTGFYPIIPKSLK